MQFSVIQTGAARSKFCRDRICRFGFLLRIAKHSNVKLVFIAPFENYKKMWFDGPRGPISMHSRTYKLQCLQHLVMSSVNLSNCFRNETCYSVLLYCAVTKYFKIMGVHPLLTAKQYFLRSLNLTCFYISVSTTSITTDAEPISSESWSGMMNF